MAKTLTFCDPIHGFIAFTADEAALLKPIIQTPLFQRLRYIKQLGLSDLLFPCAVHTRFSHSLGVCYTAKKIYEKLTGENGLTREKALLMQAALLHDIGHGPFSHAFEEFIHHTNKHLRHDQHWLDAALKSLEIDPGVISVIKRENPKQAYLSDIVNSQLDADRMDYLLRDSHFCGVTYGQFEQDWLINSLEIAQVSDNGVKSPRVCVNIKGMSALEHFIMARRLMKRYVYTHHHTLAADHLLVSFLRVLSRALIEAQQYDGELAQVLASCAETPLGRLLIAIESDKTDEFAFAEKYFDDYQCLIDDDIRNAVRAFAVIADNTDVCQLAARLYHRHMPKAIALSRDQLPEIQAHVDVFLASHREIAAWQLTIHTQNFSSYQTQTRDKLHLCGVNGTVSVDQESNVLSSLSNQVEDSCHLFVDQAIFAKVTSLLSEIHRL